MKLLLSHYIMIVWYNFADISFKKIQTKILLELIHSRKALEKDIVSFIQNFHFSYKGFC